MWQSYFSNGRYFFDWVYTHKFPYQLEGKHTCKHNTARKARFKARHKG